MERMNENKVTKKYIEKFEVLSKKNKRVGCQDRAKWSSISLPTSRRIHWCEYMYVCILCPSSIFCALF